MKKSLFAMLILFMMFSLVACGKKEMDEQSTTDGLIVNEEVNLDTEEIEDTEEKEDEDNSGDVYSNKVYYVGKDIQEGSYIVNCTKSDYGMDFIVFESEKDYENFQNANRFTIGEYSAAIEQYAWIDYYIEEGEASYIGLRAGNVILLDNGMCEFSTYDITTSNMLYPGVYVVGEDIDATILDIKCISDYMNITFFENKENYTLYHQTSRFTVGEESDAIEQHSSSTDFVSQDEISSANLEYGMVLMIEDGVGEYEVDEGPVIN